MDSQKPRVLDTDPQKDFGNASENFKPHMKSPSGSGKTAIFGEMAKRIITQQGNNPPPRKITITRAVADIHPDLPDKLKPFILEPLSEKALGQILDKMIDRHEGLPERLRPGAKAIAAVADTADMAAALAGKYPVYGQRVSVKSGERLAESFTSGTAGATAPLKPLKLKSGRVGFLALN